MKITHIIITLGCFTIFLNYQKLQIICEICDPSSIPMWLCEHVYLPMWKKKIHNLCKLGLINTPELVRLGYNGFSKLYRPKSQKVLWNSYEELRNILNIPSCILRQVYIVTGRITLGRGIYFYVRIVHILQLSVSHFRFCHITSWRLSSVFHLQF